MFTVNTARSVPEVESSGDGDDTAAQLAAHCHDDVHLETGSQHNVPPSTGKGLRRHANPGRTEAGESSGSAIASSAWQTTTPLIRDGPQTFYSDPDMKRSANRASGERSDRDFGTTTHGMTNELAANSEQCDARRSGVEGGGSTEGLALSANDVDAYSNRHPFAFSPEAIVVEPSPPIVLGEGSLSDHPQVTVYVEEDEGEGSRSVAGK